MIKHQNVGVNYCCICKQLIVDNDFWLHINVFHPHIQYNGLQSGCPANPGPGFGQGAQFQQPSLNTNATANLTTGLRFPVPQQSSMPQQQQPSLPANCIPKLPTFPGPYTCPRCGFSLGFDANAYAVHEVYCCGPYG